MAKNINKLDWEPLTVLTDDEVYEYFKRSKYLFRRTHSNKRSCTVDDHDSSHSSLVAYYSCVSKNCIREDKESCPARRLLKRCDATNKNHIYKLGEHSDNVHGMYPLVI